MSDIKNFRSLFLFIVLSFVYMLLLFIYCDLLNFMVMYFPKKLNYHHYFYQGYFQIKNVSNIISFTIEHFNFTQSDLKAKSKVITKAKQNKSNIVIS